MKLSDLFGQKKPQEPREENPYLNARRAWNDHVGSVVSAHQTWQVIGILSLLIALTAIGGIIHVGSQSKFIPYVVEVDKRGQTIALGPAAATSPVDPRVVHATIAEFISDARLVTPDGLLQRKSLFRAYAKLVPGDPAITKMNQYFNGSEGANPFKRAQEEMVSVEVLTVLPQTKDTWQVDWVERVLDRQGNPKEEFQMRALITVYVALPTETTTDAQLRNNPMNIFVRDFSWSRLLMPTG